MTKKIGLLVLLLRSCCALDLDVPDQAKIHVDDVAGLSVGYKNVNADSHFIAASYYDGAKAYTLGAETQSRPGVGLIMYFSKDEVMQAIKDKDKIKFYIGSYFMKSTSVLTKDFNANDIECNTDSDRTLIYGYVKGIRGMEYVGHVLAGNFRLEVHIYNADKASSKTIFIKIAKSAAFVPGNG